MDPRTAFALSIVFMLLNGGVLGVMQKGLSTAAQAAATDWRIGTLLAAGGSILLAAQTEGSAWLVLPVGNTFLLLGFTLYWRSVRRFDGVADTWWLFAPAGCAALLLTWFVVVQPVLWVRVLVSSLGGAIAVLGCIYSLLRHRGAQLEVSRVVLVALMTLVQIFMTFRAAYFSLYLRDADSILSPSYVLNVVSPLSVAVLPVIGTTAFLVMCLQRLQAELAVRAVELDEKNVALTHAIRAREDAERIARHDLKTPLASIAAMPGLLRTGRSIEPEQEIFLGMIENAARRALNMVSLSLDLYRMESGTYDFQPRAVDLAAVVRLTMHDIASHAISKHVQMRFSGGDDPVMVAADELLCYSCVANLVKNAVEAASDGSEVSLVLKIDEQVALTIHNDTAVPMDLRGRFFEKYATTGKVGGTGLGTYSSHLLAKAQGGSLEMETSDTDGTRLILKLEPAQGALEVDATIPGGRAVQLASGAQVSGGGSLTVLIVDDDEYNCKVLSSRLAKLSVEVDTALNGRYAVEWCFVQRPDLIFMDIQMPVMDGVQAMQRIRELQRARRQIPSVIVAFSSDDDPESRARFLALGFDNSVGKPASTQELMIPMDGLCAVTPLQHSPSQIARPLAKLMPDMVAFIASRFELVDQLEQAAKLHDDGMVRSLAHSLNGSLAMHGFAWGADLCASLENNPQQIYDVPSPVHHLSEYLRLIPIVVSREVQEESAHNRAQIDIERGLSRMSI